MILAFSPIRDAAPLTIERRGATLVLNDVAFDLEALVDVTPDGVSAGQTQVWAERMRMRPGPAPMARAAVT